MGKKKKDTGSVSTKKSHVKKTDPMAAPAAVSAQNYPTTDLRAALRADPDLYLGGIHPDDTPGYPGKGKKDAPALTAALGTILSAWQERLYAESKVKESPDRNVLVILQGMDTSGKSGVVRHVFGLVDPQGIKIHAFKQPTKEELEHDFLWRIRRQVPGPGMIGIFDRSQYEDVLVVRVDGLVEPHVWENRFEAINEFELDLARSGTKLIKCFLHITPQEQQARLLDRLSDSTKHWKYSPGDVAARSQWNEYMEAYNDLLVRCSTDVAPWYVIPANNKWYRNWAVASLLLEHLQEMAPQWPEADFDVAEQIAAVSNSLAA
ncbi:MAG: polyphosphate kinase 2 family protein [Propionibacteriaceae bacterium]|jgi:PPK2 family polyphosphate:nucleotide phosphotransferase|nr:polyphosphate kinase 2 family protein [Propionibacteriaceae bacterium]